MMTLVKRREPWLRHDKTWRRVIGFVLLMAMMNHQPVAGFSSYLDSIARSPNPMPPDDDGDEQNNNGIKHDEDDSSSQNGYGTTPRPAWSNNDNSNDKVSMETTQSAPNGFPPSMNSFGPNTKRTPFPSKPNGPSSGNSWKNAMNRDIRQESDSKRSAVQPTASPWAPSSSNNSGKTFSNGRFGSNGSLNSLGGTNGLKKPGNPVTPTTSNEGKGKVTKDDTSRTSSNTWPPPPRSSVASPFPNDKASTPVIAPASWAAPPQSSTLPPKSSSPLVSPPPSDGSTIPWQQQPSAASSATPKSSPSSWSPPFSNASSQQVSSTANSSPWKAPPTKQATEYGNEGTAWKPPPPKQQAAPSDKSSSSTWKQPPLKQQATPNVKTSFSSWEPPPPKQQATSSDKNPSSPWKPPAAPVPWKQQGNAFADAASTTTSTNNNPPWMTKSNGPSGASSKDTSAQSSNSWKPPSTPTRTTTGPPSLFGSAASQIKTFPPKDRQNPPPSSAPGTAALPSNPQKSNALSKGSRSWTPPVSSSSTSNDNPKTVSSTTSVPRTLSVDSANWSQTSPSSTSAASSTWPPKPSNPPSDDNSASSTRNFANSWNQAVAQAPTKIKSPPVPKPPPNPFAAPASTTQSSNVAFTQSTLPFGAKPASPTSYPASSTIPQRTPSPPPPATFPTSTGNSWGSSVATKKSSPASTSKSPSTTISTSSRSTTKPPPFFAPTKESSPKTDVGGYSGWGAESKQASTANVGTGNSVSSYLQALTDKREGIQSSEELPSKKNLLDNFVEMQIEMQFEKDETTMQEMFKQMIEEKANTYGNLFKKKLRLAITGGVSVRKQLAVERPAPELDTKGMTERILKRVGPGGRLSGAGSSTTWEDFLLAEENWARLRKYMPGKKDPEPVPFVVVNDIQEGLRSPECFGKLGMQRDKQLDYDIAVCGGTMGVFYATALQIRGHRVCLIESGELRGREQEWNVSMDELMRLVELGVLSDEDIDAAVQTEFPGCRSGFKNKEVPLTDGYTDNGIGYECFIDDVLNLGVSPAILVERVARRFEELGGVIIEYSQLSGIFVVTSIGAALDLGPDMEPLTANVVIDSMGNNSPITRQQRYGKKPDGVCAVVGTCAAGYDPETNLFGDIMYSNTPIQDKKKSGKLQYFWQSFPVGIGRNGRNPGSSDVKTTYLLAYMDAHQKRPKLKTLLDDYWKLLPQYQPSIENPETDLLIERVFFAYFPTYRDSPLPPGFDRILSVGDASGIQSPLSFGGFGALTRHLGRITNAVTEALEYGMLRKEDLAEINAYQPNLSALWMLQTAMSVRMGQPFVDPRFVNRIMATNLEVMNNMGPRVIKPLLQDVPRFGGLVGSLTRSFTADPTLLPYIINWVGLPTVVDWFGHVGAMGSYAALDTIAAPVLRPIADRALKDDRRRFRLHRRMDAWKFGSGNDYDIKNIPKK